jgi:D-alanyl-D-alanine dipeptidase
LKKVQEDLAKIGHGLLVYDAYRPLRGTLAMMAWAKRERQVHLLDAGYIARRSGHNKGHTLDLTIVHLETGEPIDMGTTWDTLDERSHTLNIQGTPLDNRLVLKTNMETHGWKNYWKEWWHFSFQMEGEDKLGHRDIPYSCSEPDEGRWVPPRGWSIPNFTMPQRIPVSPCQDTK